MKTTRHFIINVCPVGEAPSRLAEAIWTTPSRLRCEVDPRETWSVQCGDLFAKGGFTPGGYTYFESGNMHTVPGLFEFVRKEITKMRRSDILCPNWRLVDVLWHKWRTRWSRLTSQ